MPLPEAQRSLRREQDGQVRGVAVPMPDDLMSALDAVPGAKAKWLALSEPDRRAYVRWVDGPGWLRRRRIDGTITRVLDDRPQRGLWGRIREGAAAFGDEVSSGRCPTDPGAGTGLS